MNKNLTVKIKRSVGQIIGCIVLCLCGFVTSAQQRSEPPYKDRLQVVESYLRQGNFREGINLLEQITQDYPLAAEVFYAKGLLYNQVNNRTEALANAEKAFSLEPKNLGYANLLLDIYKKDKRLDLAIAFIEELKKEFPEKEGLDRELLILLAENKQPDKAEQYYKHLITGSHSDTLDLVMSEVYLNNNQLMKAKSILKSLERKSKLPDVYAYLAYIYNKEGKAKEAIAVLDKGIKLSNDKSLYLDLADIYKAQGKTEQVFLALKEAFSSNSTPFENKFSVFNHLVYNETMFSDAKLIQLADVLVLAHPDMLDAQVVRGELFWRKGSVEDARSIFLKIVSSNPNYINAWRLLVNTDLALNQVDEAIKHSQEAIRFNPNNAQLLYFSGIAYLEKKDLATGRDVLEAALNYSENENNYLRSMIYGTLGDLYHQLGEESLSDAAYEEAIELDSTNVGALNNYAYYLAQRKKALDRAANFSLKSNELEPHSATFMDTYAWVLFRQEKFADALSWIEKAIRLDGNSPVLYEHYGDILMKLGKEKEALKQWQKAIDIHTSSSNGGNIDSIKKKIKERKYVE